MRVFRDAADIQSYAEEVLKAPNQSRDDLGRALLAIANGIVNAELHDALKPADAGEHGGKVTIQVRVK